MNLEKRIAAFIALGETLTHLDEDEYKLWAANAQSLNPWFTADNFALSLNGICRFLEKSSMQQWLAPYALASAPKDVKVGVVMAGNIPLVGFHDYLCVLLAGFQADIKLSSKDNYLLPLIHKKLVQIEPFFLTKVRFVEQLKGVDAYIATGNNNSARYFAQYFSKKPHLIRKSRTSIAVLDGTETAEELTSLTGDLFQYFGLGCRSVTYALTPPDYNWSPFLAACDAWYHVIDHTRYRNNYEYNRSVLLVNSAPHLDNGFLLVQPHANLHSPIGVLNQSTYTSKEEVTAFLAQHQEEIQCVVGHDYLPFGTSQQPQVWDYADNVDTVDFLLKL